MPIVGVNPRKFGRNKDVDLAALVEFDFPTHVKVDVSSVSETKAEAGACHASQGGVQMRRGFMGIAARLMGEHEHYMRAYPPVDGNHCVAKDLFDGI